MINISNNNSNGSTNTNRTSLSRLEQLSRVATLNLALAKQLQQQQQQQQQHQQQQQQQQQDAASGNLSPNIMVNVGGGLLANASGPILTSINNATAIRSPRVAVEVVTQDGGCSGADKVSIRLGDYVFYEQANSTEAFATAVNSKSGALFYWKKFDRRDYMKKLQPYFVMDGTCDQIYRFSEILFQSNYPQRDELQATANSNDDEVYVLFEPHYGDLHSFMKEKKRLEEHEARLIFRQCVEAVQACHENGIIIRDIKLKKFVFLDEQRTKIGLANLEDCLLLDEDAENDLIKSQQGCPAYVSPEVLNPIQTSYSGKLSDAWSLGIILYTLLVGRYPFHHPTIANMFARIARGKFQVPLSVQLSLDARILLRSLIRVKPDERLLPHEILAHNWFRHNEAESAVRFSSSSSSSLATSFASSSSSIHLNPCQQTKTTNVGNVHLNLANRVESSSGEDACVPQLSTNSI